MRWFLLWRAKPWRIDRDGWRTLSAVCTIPRIGVKLMPQVSSGSSREIIAGTAYYPGSMPAPRTIMLSHSTFGWGSKPFEWSRPIEFLAGAELITAED
jgi:hypothetical protein